MKCFPHHYLLAEAELREFGVTATSGTSVTSGVPSPRWEEMSYRETNTCLLAIFVATNDCDVFVTNYLCNVVLM